MKGLPHFVIVGGGTAGWLAALMIGDAIARGVLAARVTVVDSSKLPTVGVGEGSTAVLRQMLLHLKCDEFEFLKATGATIKYGIRHRDWRRIGHTYDAPIDDPHQVLARPDGAPAAYLDTYALSAGKRLPDAHLFGWLMQQEKAPFARRDDGSLIPVGPFHHAYHFDQALVGAYLRSQAKDVAIVDATVAAVDRDPADGDITALLFDDGRRMDGDFFIDCTGFRRALIGDALGGRWLSFADALPVNRAMPFWVDYEEDAEIPPYTLAWARDAGWMWAIPTQARLGCGYVYSDAFCDADTAQAEIEAALGHAIAPRPVIKFDAGRLESPWLHNCLGLGLAASFLEPLEATSIHGTVVQLMMFVDYCLRSPAEMTSQARREYNTAAARQVDDFRDFINLHYVGERADTPFWQAMAAQHVTPATRRRLELWSRKTPDRSDFPPFPGGFAHVEQQLYIPVLNGLGHLNRDVARAEMARIPNVRAAARKATIELTREYRLAAGKALGHRAFLAGL